MKSGKGNGKRPVYLREIQIRYKKKRVKGDSHLGKPVLGARQLVELFSDLQNEAKEKLITVSLDAQLHILCFEVVAVGSVTSIYLKPFEAVRSAIALNASSIVIIHNHPSGDPKPSDQDKKLTKDLKKICELGGIDFQDHIVIGDGKYYSFDEQRALKELKKE